MTKNLFKKDNLKPLAVLTAICVVVAALLAAVNMVAAPIIEAAANEKAYAALKVVLPDGKNFEELSVTEDYPKDITKAYKADGGYVFEASVTGNKPNLVIMCGIDESGKIVGIDVISHEETPSFWETVLSLVDGTNSPYSGKGQDDIKAELISGATNSSNGVYKAVTAALDAYTVAIGGEVADEPEETLPTTEEEIIILSEVLLGAEIGTLTDVTPEGTTNVKRVYKDKSGVNYAVYTVVISQYGTPETESVIHINNMGVIKGIKKITWKVSDPAPDWGYNPPNEDRVNQLYKDFVDKNSETVDEVDIKTGATNTGENLLAAVKEALETVNNLTKEELPTPEEEIISISEELLGAESGTLVAVEFGESENIKRVYNDKSGKNYAVYTVVMSQYGTPETETIVHIGSDGVVKKVKKLIWKTSDAIYGYVPPKEEEYNPFYERLEGTNSETIGDVELVTNATNTSTNLRNAVEEAITVVNELVKKSMPTPEEEIVSLAEELLGAESGSLVKANHSESEFIKLIYKDKSGKNYAVYTVVISQYGTPETETIIHINNAGIIKGIKKITWKVSDAKPEWGYNPPSEERVNQLFGDFVDKTADTVDDVDLNTGATNTSENLLNAIKEALDLVDIAVSEETCSAEESKTPRIVGILILAFGIGAVVAFVATKAIIRRKKR